MKDKPLRLLSQPLIPISFFFFRFGLCCFGMQSDSPAVEGVGVRLLAKMIE
jgi:hypothetical protein